MGEIRPCTMNHVDRYGEIYAKAFSCEPWNDPWKQEDAVIHVKEILEMRQSYGLEFIEEGLIVGFLLGSSMLFHQLAQDARDLSHERNAPFCSADV